MYSNLPPDKRMRDTSTLCNSKTTTLIQTNPENPFPIIFLSTHHQRQNQSQISNPSSKPITRTKHPHSPDQLKIQSIESTRKPAYKHMPLLVSALVLQSNILTSQRAYTHCLHFPWMLCYRKVLQLQLGLILKMGLAS